MQLTSRVPLVDLTEAFEPGPTQDAAVDAIRRACEDVPTVAGAFVVNLGDLMAAWTNDRWTSTLHRVVVPDGDTDDRLSIAFFHQPAYDARIECIPTCTSPHEPPRYAPTTSGEWILSMLRKVQLESP